MPLLQNHIAVITGAASGIGRAIALGYAREGAHVVLLDINDRAAAEAAAEIRSGGGKAMSFALDVTKREDCVAVAKGVADEIGPVSILVEWRASKLMKRFIREVEPDTSGSKSPRKGRHRSVTTGLTPDESPSKPDKIGPIRSGRSRSRCAARS